MTYLAKAAAAALTVWGCSTAFALSDPATQGTDVSLAGQSASPDVIYAERWIQGENDNRGHPFAIVDKKAARIFVFAADGKLAGASPTLLGAQRGDVAVPGSEHKAPSQLLPSERRTPAGRFHSIPGRNNFGEDVVWVDYDASIAIHRVRPDHAQASRLQSLADDLPDDKRRSLGCVVVPESFLARVVMPTLGHSTGVVYVLPEEEPVQAMFTPPAPRSVTAAAARPPANPLAPAALAARTVIASSTPEAAPRLLDGSANAPRAIEVSATAPRAGEVSATPVIVQATATVTATATAQASARPIAAAAATMVDAPPAGPGR
jgi:hypothetical protein